MTIILPKIQRRIVTAKCRDFISVSQCSSNEFMCSSGQCISKKLRCNGFKDCVDGSDEACSCKEYCSGSHLCSNNECLFNTKSSNILCNGVIDCSDGSDENTSACLESNST